MKKVGRAIERIGDEHDAAIDVGKMRCTLFAEEPRVRQPVVHHVGDPRFGGAVDDAHEVCRRLLFPAKRGDRRLVLANRRCRALCGEDDRLEEKCIVSALGGANGLLSLRRASSFA